MRITAKNYLRVMKLTAILLTFFAVHVMASTDAQTITYSGNNVPLKQVLQAVKKQTGYLAVYNAAQVEATKPVTVNAKDEPLAKFLTEILKGQGLEFSIENKTIVISPKEKNTAPVTQGLNPGLNSEPLPPIDIHGTVTDSAGNPLVGALVKVKNDPAKGSVTNENGEFQVTGVSNDATLVVSFVGYATREYSVASKADIRVVLRVVDKQLAEVAIQSYSSGYQKIPKERATGSFAFMNNELFNKRVSSDILSRLDGNVSGLIFNKNTQQSPDISIRGHNTLFANDQPLIVVDNFAYDGNLNSLNPNDVESITVLKDAAAASIWGVRSGNGVIVITTKRGSRNGKVQMAFNSNISSTNRLNPVTDPNFIDAGSYIDIEQKLFDMGYYNGTITDRSAYVSPAVQIMADAKAGRITQADATAQLNTLRSQDVRRDVQKYFYRNELTQQYNLNLSGGNANSDYYISLGYDKNLSGTVGNSNDRVTLRTNYNFTPVKNLTFSLDYNLSLINSISNGGQGLYNTLPYLQYADGSGNPLAVAMDYSNYYKDSIAKIGFQNLSYKPLAELNYTNNTNKTTDNRIVVGARYNFLKHFNVGLNYQYQRLNASGQILRSDSSYYTRKLIDQFAQRASNGSFTYPVPLGGIISQNNIYQTSNQARLELNYKQQFSRDHDIVAIGGAEVRQNIFETAGNLLYGFNSLTGNTNPNINFADDFPNNPIGSSRIPGNSDGITKTTNNYISYFGNASYTFRNLYTFSISGRVDHSNLFGVKTNQKAVPLFSMGLSWNLSQEKFYHINWLPNLRPRATFGYNANINTSVSAFTTILQSANSIFSGLNWAEIQNPGNPQLQWEKVRNINLAIDYGFKRNIVSGSIEYYLKKGYNLFGYSPLAPSTGLTQFFGNTANTEGHGLDVTINTRNIDKSDFRWTTNFLLSFVKDKVTKYDVKNTAGYYIRNSSGATLTPLPEAPVFAIYAYHFAGLTNDKGDPIGILNGKQSTDYNAILGQNSLDSLPLIGNGRPSAFGSMRNSFNWKGFSFSFLISYKLNYYFRRQSGSSVEFAANGGTGSSDYYLRWQKPGDETTTNIPSFEYPPFNTNRSVFYSYSDALVEKGDQIRFQDVSLSYEFTRAKEKWLPINSLQLYAYAYNLGILWRANHKGIDPDAPYGTKLPKSFSVGIKANF